MTARQDVSHAPLSKLTLTQTMPEPLSNEDLGIYDPYVNWGTPEWDGMLAELSKMVNLGPPTGDAVRDIHGLDQAIHAVWVQGIWQG